MTCIHFFVSNIFFCRSTSRKPGSGHPTKITNHVQQIVEWRMRQKYATTDTQLHELLTHNWISVLLCTVVAST